MQCLQCKGPWHPATGHVFTPEARLCGPCARQFFSWMRATLRRRCNGHELYAAAATSIRAGIFPAPERSTPTTERIAS